MDVVGVFLYHSFCKQVFACNSHKCTFNRFVGCCLVTFSESCWWDCLPTTLESAISFDICLKVFFQTKHVLHQFLLHTSTAASLHITYNAMFTWKVNDLNSRSKNFLGLWPAVLLGEFLPVGEQTNKASVTVQRTFWQIKTPSPQIPDFDKRFQHVTKIQPAGYLTFSTFLSDSFPQLDLAFVATKSWNECNMYRHSLLLILWNKWTVQWSWSTGLLLQVCRTWNQTHTTVFTFHTCKAFTFSTC
jgi:hypothetical protein